MWWFKLLQVDSTVGRVVNRGPGATVGAAVCAEEGDADCPEDGAPVGACTGAAVGSSSGAAEGAGTGRAEGAAEGASEGRAVGPGVVWAVGGGWGIPGMGSRTAQVSAPWGQATPRQLISGLGVICGPPPLMPQPSTKNNNRKTAVAPTPRAP